MLHYMLGVHWKKMFIVKKLKKKINEIRSFLSEHNFKSKKTRKLVEKKFKNL